MTPTETTLAELRKQVIQFQKDTLEEWSTGVKNVGMINLAYKFTDELTASIEQIVTEVIGKDEVISDDVGMQDYLRYEIQAANDLRASQRQKLEAIIKSGKDKP